MGTNRRYADHYDRAAIQRQQAEAMEAHEPDSLKDWELELDTVPLTRAPIGQPVTAWVRYGPVSMQVEAEAVAWTPYATAIRWATPSGAVHRAWVWSGAVRPRGSS